MGIREAIEALFWIYMHHLWISDLRGLIEFLRGKAFILKRKKREAWDLSLGAWKDISTRKGSKDEGTDCMSFLALEGWIGVLKINLYEWKWRLKFIWVALQACMGKIMGAEEASRGSE